MSFYDEHPAAFEDAVERGAFQDRLLDGTHLKHFLASDPENASQSRARDDLRMILERAWLAAQAAKEAAYRQGALIA